MAGKGLALPFPAPVSSQPRLPAQAQHSGRFNIVSQPIQVKLAVTDHAQG